MEKNKLVMTVKGKDFDLGSVIRNIMITLTTVGIIYLVNTSTQNRENIAVITQKLINFESANYYTREEAHKDNEIIKLKLELQKQELEQIQRRIEADQ